MCKAISSLAIVIAVMWALSSDNLIQRDYEYKNPVELYAVKTKFTLTETIICRPMSGVSAYIVLTSEPENGATKVAPRQPIDGL